MAKITVHGGPSGDGSDVRVFEDQAEAGREMRAQRETPADEVKVETFDHPVPAPTTPAEPAESEPVEDRPPPAKKTTAKKAAPPAADRPAGDG